MNYAFIPPCDVKLDSLNTATYTIYPTPETVNDCVPAVGVVDFKVCLSYLLYLLYYIIYFAGV